MININISPHLSLKSRLTPLKMKI